MIAALAVTAFVFIWAAWVTVVQASHAITPRGMGEVRMYALARYTLAAVVSATAWVLYAVLA